MNSIETWSRASHNAAGETHTQKLKARYELLKYLAARPARGSRLPSRTSVSTVGLKHTR